MKKDVLIRNLQISMNPKIENSTGGGVELELLKFIKGNQNYINLMRDIFVLDDRELIELVKDLKK